MHFSHLPLWLLVAIPLAPVQPPEPIRLGRPAKAVTVPAPHRTSIAFSPDGKKLAWVHHVPEVLPNDGGSLLINLWDVDKRLPLVDMKPANQFTYASSPVRFTPNGRMLAMGCFQLTTEHEQLAKPGTVVKNSVRVWLVASGRELPIVPREDGTLDGAWQAVAVGADGKAMAAVSSKAGRVWKLPEGEVGRKFDLEPASHLILSADGKLAAGTAKDNGVHIWQTEDGKETQKLPGSGRALGFSPDGKLLASLHDDKVCLWQIDTGKQLWAVPAKLGKDENHGPRLDFAPDGKRLAWNEDGKITLADAATGKPTATLKGEPGPIAFSPEGTRLAVACPDGTALVWNLEKAKK